MCKKLFNQFLKILDRVFLSVPFAIFLILFICVICLIGITTSYTQIFQTKWFLLCLSAVGFMMIYCSVRRFPRLIKLYLTGPANVERHLNQTTEIFSYRVASKDKSSSLDTLSGIFNGHAYRKNTTSRDIAEGCSLYEKARLGILGPHIIHLGIAVILVAGIITAWGGEVYDIYIKEGASHKLKGTETRLTLEKFSILPSGEKEMGDEYASRLRINKGDGSIDWRTLKVNSPLRVDEFRFYQTRYSYDIERFDVALIDRADDKIFKTVSLVVGKRVSIPELDISIKLEDFIPDFAIDAQGEVAERSQLVVNPAGRISIFSPASSDQIVHQGWIFRGFVAPHSKEHDDYTWKIVIDHLRMRNTSGIKVARNPGEFLTYFGLIILVIGSVLSCYKFYRCVFVQCTHNSETDMMDIRCFALNAKNMFEFERELKKIKEKLQVSFKQATC